MQTSEKVVNPAGVFSFFYVSACSHVLYNSERKRERERERERAQISKRK